MTGVSSSDVNAVNQVLTQLVNAVLKTFPRVNGSFTMTAAATTVVTQTAVTANCRIFLASTNAAAGTLVGSAKSPYISVKTVGASFTVATANAASAAGTETFDYVIVIPS